MLKKITSIVTIFVMVCSLSFGYASMEPTGMLMAGDELYKMPYYVIDSGVPGVTAMVVGGVHGDETAGYNSASGLTDFKPLTGKIIILPKAEKWGIDRNLRRFINPDSFLSGPGIYDPNNYLFSDPGIPFLPDANDPVDRKNDEIGNLNRFFPNPDYASSGYPAIGPVAQNIWSFIQNQNVKWLLDCHESKTYYNLDNDRLGQTIIAMPSGAGFGWDYNDAKFIIDNINIDSGFVDSNNPDVIKSGVDTNKVFRKLNYPVKGSLARAVADTWNSIANDSVDRRAFTLETAQYSNTSFTNEIPESERIKYQQLGQKYFLVKAGILSGYPVCTMKTPAGVYNGQITVSWDIKGGMGPFYSEVMYRTDSDPNWYGVFNPGVGNSCYFYGSGQKYYFRVRARSTNVPSFGETMSDWSVSPDSIPYVDNLVQNPLLNIDQDEDDVVDGYVKYSGTGNSTNFYIDYDRAAQQIDITSSSNTNRSQISSDPSLYISVTAGQTYDLSFEGMTKSVSGTGVQIKPRVEWYNGTTLISGNDGAYSKPTDFTRVSMGSQGITAPANANKARLMCCVAPAASGSTGTAWFRNISFGRVTTAPNTPTSTPTPTPSNTNTPSPTPTPSATPTASVNNLIPSPSMDQDSDSNGTVNGFVPYLGTGNSCSFTLDTVRKAQQMYINSSTTVNRCQVSTSPYIDVVPGNVYKLSVDSKVSNTNGSGSPTGSPEVQVKMMVEWYNGSDKLTDVSSSYTQPTAFTRLSLTNCTAPANANKARIIFAVAPVSAGKTGSAWFKNACFCQ